MKRLASVSLASLSCAAVLLAGCSTEQSGTRGAVESEGTAPAAASGQWVVGIGDSYMSGEGGRWASNGLQNGAESRSADTKRLGWKVDEETYFDSPDGKSELIKGCHRSESAPMHVGAPFQSVNLACSGAITSTVPPIKPGIDFGKAGMVGQAQLLQDFASTHDVAAVMLSIGGNDMGFGDIIKSCANTYVKYPIKGYCSTNDEITKLIDSEAKKSLVTKIVGAISNVKLAMKNAGYENSEWRLVFQGPPRVIPVNEDTWLGDGGFKRQDKCGLPFKAKDQDWATNAVGPFLQSAQEKAVKQSGGQRGDVRMTFLDVEYLFEGHLLCEKGTTQTFGNVVAAPNWKEGGQSVEWVRRINICEQEGLCTGDDPSKKNMYGSEPMHPTYWGQRALAACALEALQAGATSGSPYAPAKLTCVNQPSTDGLDLQTKWSTL